MGYVLNLTDDVMHLSGLCSIGIWIDATVEIVRITLVFECFEVGFFILVFFKELNATQKWNEEEDR